uniref:tyrosine-type recombinase/integrase n=1 Tax=Sporichthya sp. TaxID=65475 RepID=UPI001851B541
MSRSGRGHVEGPLAPYGEGFRESLLARGYTWDSAAHLVHLMAHVSRWLEARGLDPRELTPAVVEEFLCDRRAAGYRHLISARAMAGLVEYLRAAGVLAAREPAGPSTELDRLIVRYEEYLARERGLAAASIRMYLPVARRFLAQVCLDGVAVFDGVGGARVTAFVRGQCQGRCVATAKVTVTGLRSLLRFLYLDGQMPVLLSAAAPGVACWQLAALPEALSAADVARLLEGCDRTGALGRRDFAILTVLARLGLRAGEISALELGDVHWRAGEITVRGKGGRQDLLPLPVEVGAAVAAWLWSGRPAGTGCPAVFIGDRAPHGRLAPTAVSAVVR